MAVKLKKIPTKIVLWSVIVYLALLYIVTRQGDLMSALAYAAIAVLISEIAAPQVFRWDIKKMFVIGAVISLAYHVIGMTIGEFTVTMPFMLWAAVQQGIVTAIAYKIGGGKR